MHNFLMKFGLAVAVTLGAFAIATPARAQQADEDTPPATSHQQQPSAKSQSEQPRDAHVSSADDPQTQDSLAFTGSVAKEKGRIVLKDPVTKMSYQFANESKAKQFLGRQVKVIGRLDMSSNTIHIQSIEPLT